MRRAAIPARANDSVRGVDDTLLHILTAEHFARPHPSSQIDPAGAAPRRLVNWFALRRPLQYMVQVQEVVAEFDVTHVRRRAAARERYQVVSTKAANWFAQLTS